MNSKFTLALIALVGVGVFALPSTMALFAGQHSFYNIDATGNQIPCVKCHGDVKAELSSGGSTVTGTAGPHANFKCEYCHRAESGLSSGDDAVAKISYSNGTNSLYLVTTIGNYETGNFPYFIDYDSSGVSGASSVDNWLGHVYNLTSATWVNQSAFDNDNHLYAGKLGYNSTAGAPAAGRYQMGYASEISTRTLDIKNVVSLDTQSTKDTAVDPRKVNFSGTKLDFNWAGSREVTPGTKYHAASLVSCLECHGGEQEKGAAGYEIETAEPYNHAGWLVDASDVNSKCANCHYGDSAHTPSFEHNLEAGGFGLTTYGNGSDTGSVEAHKPFVAGNASTGVLRNEYGAANEACVGCHTHVAVDINFQKKYKLVFDANAFNGGTNGKNGSWSVGAFGAEGTVDISAYGNSDGSVFATSNKSYNWDATTGKNGMLYINGNTTTPITSGLNNTANDSAGALK